MVDDVERVPVSTTRSPQLRLDADVDAVHVAAHLDDDKPEGVENKAIEQIAFAVRIVLNEVDLASTEEGLAEVEGRIRQIDALAPIARTSFGEGRPRPGPGCGGLRPVQGAGPGPGAPRPRRRDPRGPGRRLRPGRGPGRQYPSREAVLAVEPDLVVGGFASAFGDTTIEDKRRLLRTHPVASILEAVRAERYVALGLTDVAPDIRIATRCARSRRVCTQHPTVPAPRSPRATPSSVTWPASWAWREPGRSSAPSPRRWPHPEAGGTLTPSEQALACSPWQA